MTKKATWVLIADGARAHFYVEGGGGLVPALDHDLAVSTRAAPRQAGTDRPGRAFDSAGNGRHAMEPPTPWRVHEKRLLARAIATELRHARDRHAVEGVVVVAPPEMLGDLRDAFEPALRRLVVAEVGKDLTHVALPDLPAHLGQALSR